jgi:hypothetical protein
MTLEEAKRMGTDIIAGRDRAGWLVRDRVIETLLRALGEPSDADREAAAWCRYKEDYEAKMADLAVDAEMAQACRELSARYRRAAEALLRSPAAIRRAAIDECAVLVEESDSVRYRDGSDNGPGTVAALAKAIRALDGGAQ